MILKDQVVIVTGAGPGMGQAACRGAAREGAKVVVTARSRQAIEEVAQEIVAAGGEAIAVPLDVTDMDQCKAAAEQSWSLSPLTLPHPLVRVLVAESLYRAWSITTNHPYHRE